MKVTDKRFNSNGSINIEELNRAYAQHYSKYDEMKEMKKILDRIILKDNLE